MINILNPGQIETAKRFAHAIIDNKSAIGNATLHLISEKSRLFASRKFCSIDELSWGSGEGRFVDELISYASDVIRDDPQTRPMLWDNGYTIADIGEQDRALYVASLFPDLVQALQFDGGRPVVSSFDEGLRRCISFAPVAIFTPDDFSMERHSLKSKKISAIVMSAFDQEGAIVWC